MITDLFSLDGFGVTLQLVALELDGVDVVRVGGVRGSNLDPGFVVVVPNIP